jgi:hypothetical protein
MTSIGEHIDIPNQQLERAGGYDPNIVLNGLCAMPFLK